MHQQWAGGGGDWPNVQTAGKQDTNIKANWPKDQIQKVFGFTRIRWSKKKRKTKRAAVLNKI